MLATTGPLAQGDSSKKKFTNSSKMTQEAPGTVNGRGGSNLLSNGESVKKSSSLGGFLKILSPKYHRSRSKSPSVAMATVNGDQQQRCKNKSWVTVEIKNGHHGNNVVDDEPDRCLQQQAGGVVRSGTDGQLVASTGHVTESCSIPGSPVSTSSSAEFGSSSPMSRVRNLFGRNSFKKQHRQKSATLSSPRDISGWSYDVAKSSADIPAADDCRPRQCRQLAISSTLSDRQLHDPVKRQATSAKSKFDAFVAQLSHKSGFAGGRADEKVFQETAPTGARTAAAASIALSEENLVSKSLSVVDHQCPASIAKSPANNLLSASTGYYSQDSVFDTSTTSSSSAGGAAIGAESRVPSYVRLSCTLSGYKNYRSVDLRTPSPVRTSPTSSTSSPMPRIVENFVDSPLGGAARGKSIVERRLEKFQQISNNHDSTEDRSAAVVADSAAETPTPIRDIISNFNKLSLNSTPNTRLRQKPPPLPPPPPPPPPRKIDNHDEPADEERSTVVVTTNADSLLDEVLSAGDRAVDSLPSNNGDTAAVIHRDGYYDISNAAAMTSSGVSAVVVEPVTSRIDKRVVLLICQEKLTRENGALVENGAEKSAAFLNGGNHEHDSLAAMMNGFQYKTIAAEERSRLEKLLHRAEEDLSNEILQLPEHASETLRMAVGKLRLLLRKKFSTFEELIEKNLNPIADDTRPTLDSDLAGYYQLVRIELDDVDANFRAVEQLRSNGWRKCHEEDVVDSKVPLLKQPNKKSVNVASSAVGSKSSAQENAAKAKEAARQRLKDAKQAAMDRMKNDAQAINGTDKGADNNGVQFIST